MRSEHFQTMPGQHNEAIRALRVSQGHMAAAVRAFGDAVQQAHDEAVAGTLAANQAALDLLHALSDGGTR